MKSKHTSHTSHRSHTSHTSHRSTKSNSTKSNSTKSNISVICLFNNDNDNIINLKVWLDHYIWQGIDHFYLIDNGYTDKNDILDIISNNLITYDKLDRKLDRKIDYYRFIYDKYKLNKNTKWLIGADLDEFWYSKKSLKNELLNSHRDVIYSNYLIFGNNNINKHPTDIRLDNIKR